jgi:hypothetical protein
MAPGNAKERFDWNASALGIINFLKKAALAPTALDPGREGE